MSGSEPSLTGRSALPDAGPYMIFDGHCLLCSRFVRFILDRETAPDIIFVNAWSETGLALAARHGLSAADLDETYLVIKAGKAFTRSDAALEVLRRLRRPWPLLTGLKIVPKSLRDGFYTVIARNRYDWFGRSDVCFVPSPDQKSRFIL